jgi:murein DD-endopeptidase MepM/ murein hydrolase activator NlpD
MSLLGQNTIVGFVIFFGVCCMPAPCASQKPMKALERELRAGENIRIYGPNLVDGRVRIIKKNNSPYPVRLTFQIFNLPDKEIAIGEASIALRPNDVAEILAEPSRGKKFTNPIYVAWTWKPGDPSIAKSDKDFLIPLSKSEFVVCQSFDGPLTTHKNIPEAIDFCAPIGTEIVASKAGFVTLVIDGNIEGGSSPQYADKSNRIFILHGDGTISTYDHLAPKSIIVRQDQFVQQGELIAKLGMTGQTSGPHLHFAVIYYDMDGNEKYLRPKFINSRMEAVDLSYNARVGVSGRLVLESETIDPSTIRTANAQDESFICVTAKDLKKCGSTTKLEIKNSVLNEIKGPEIWASFKRVDGAGADAYFLGYDHSRGVYLKVVKASQNRFLAFWAWKARTLADVVWISIPGEFTKL